MNGGAVGALVGSRYGYRGQPNLPGHRGDPDIPGNVGVSLCGTSPRALGTSKRLGQFQRLFAGHLLWPRATAGNVIPIEKLRWSAVRKADFVAPTIRSGFVFDQTDSCHAPRSRRFGRGGKPLAVGALLPGRAATHA
jgi:hypothetical protein